jgi:hypothetical protein
MVKEDELKLEGFKAGFNCAVNQLKWFRMGLLAKHPKETLLIDTIDMVIGSLEEDLKEGLKKHGHI